MGDTPATGLLGTAAGNPRGHDTAEGCVAPRCHRAAVVWVATPNEAGRAYPERSNFGRVKEAVDVAVYAGRCTDLRVSGKTTLRGPCPTHRGDCKGRIEEGSDAGARLA